MKINVSLLKVVEDQYKDNPICANALQTMVDLVMGYENSPYRLATDNVKLAIETLKSLNVLYETDLDKNEEKDSESKSKVEPLNS